MDVQYDFNDDGDIEILHTNEGQIESSLHRQTRTSSRKNNMWGRASLAKLEELILGEIIISQKACALRSRRLYVRELFCTPSSLALNSIFSKSLVDKITNYTSTSDHQRFYENSFQGLGFIEFLKSNEEDSLILRAPMEWQRIRSKLKVISHEGINYLYAPQILNAKFLASSSFLSKEIVSFGYKKTDNDVISLHEGIV